MAFLSHHILAHDHMLGPQDFPPRRSGGPYCVAIVGPTSTMSDKGKYRIMSRRFKRRVVEPAACASARPSSQSHFEIPTVRQLQQKIFFEVGSYALRLRFKNMPLKVGVAFYIQEGNSRAGPPHWALVAHPISYSAPDVMVFQIRQTLASSWSLAHTVCSLSNTPALLGVLHIAEISMTSAVLNQFVAQFPATKNGDDPSGIPLWSCENWVIRVLHYLSQTTIPVLRLPVQTNLIYGHASRRARTLRTAPKNPQDCFAVLPLDGY